MKNFKKFWKSPTVTIGLFIAAAALIIIGGIGTARAALIKASENYVMKMAMKDIGITLVENDEELSYKNYKGNGEWDKKTVKLLKNLLDEDEVLKLGKKYDEALAVKNSGNIPTYVRVTISKKWLDADGNEIEEISPKLIGLNFLDDTGWVIDKDNSTSAEIILYYTKPLGVGETSAPLTDTLKISKKLDDYKHEVESEEDEVIDGKTYHVTTITYDYNGASFQITAKADAIQTHNAEEAILYEWGRSVTVSGKTLSLN